MACRQPLFGAKRWFGLKDCQNSGGSFGVPAFPPVARQRRKAMLLHAAALRRIIPARRLRAHPTARTKFANFSPRSTLLICSGSTRTSLSARIRSSRYRAFRVQAQGHATEQREPIFRLGGAGSAGTKTTSAPRRFGEALRAKSPGYHLMAGSNCRAVGSSCRSPIASERRSPEEW
jgi:hypothetical protein